MHPAIRLFIGGQPNQIQGEKPHLTGDLMLTAAHQPPSHIGDLSKVYAYLDSGAFSDAIHKRLTPDSALDRQLSFERKASTRWGFENWQANALVSYDLLIDETWIGDIRSKKRWTIKQADWAVQETITAAQYLNSQRERLKPRKLIFSCQGVDAIQYAECATEILKIMQPGDVFGFGGWCILGRMKRWIHTFWETISLVMPMIAKAGVLDVHIFGVLYQVALGGFAYLADKHNLKASTDSTAPLLSCTRKDPKRSGVRMPYWKDNVKWWIDTLANLRSSNHYKQPSNRLPSRQLSLFDLVA